MEKAHWLSTSNLPPISLLAIRHSLLLFATRLFFPQHSAADQRFHVLDVLAADFVGDGTDAGGARHRVPAEKQVIAGADQAGVEHHRIDIAELAGLDALGEQPPLELQ